MGPSAVHWAAAQVVSSSSAASGKGFSGSCLCKNIVELYREISCPNETKVEEHQDFLKHRGLWPLLNNSCCLWKQWQIQVPSIVSATVACILHQEFLEFEQTLRMLHRKAGIQISLLVLAVLCRMTFHCVCGTRSVLWHWVSQMCYCHSSTTGAREEAVVMAGLEESEGIDSSYLEGISVLPIFCYHEVQRKCLEPTSSQWQAKQGTANQVGLSSSVFSVS